MQQVAVYEAYRRRNYVLQGNTRLGSPEEELMPIMPDEEQARGRDSKDARFLQASD